MFFKSTVSRVRKGISQFLEPKFPGSYLYWEKRYARGGDSGAGSLNHLAEFKARFLNDFVIQNKIRTIIEFGCGDGSQLSLATYPSYFGVDVSKLALARCCRLFAGDVTKQFGHNRPQTVIFDLSLSLDVIYHLVEDEVFENYMRQLFEASRGWVVVYSSNVTDEEFRMLYSSLGAPHVRHRRFSDWIKANAPDWRLIVHQSSPYPYRPEDPINTSFSEFFVYASVEIGSNDSTRSVLQDHSG